jgi:phosphohistidine phosphatase
MKLYLVRHGEAETREIDAERPLSDKGIGQVERLAKHCAEYDVKPAHVYHSGLLRAQQTAQIIADRLGVESIGKIDHLDACDPVEPIKNLAEFWDQDTILVGHVPYMGELLYSLTEGVSSVNFHTATGVCLQKEAGHWVTQWVFHGCNS